MPRSLRREGDALGVIAGGEGDHAAARAGASSSCRRAFIAPRILKEPARCRFSHFRRTSTPRRSESEWLVEERGAVDVGPDAGGGGADVG